MDHVCHKVIVALELLSLEVRLDYGFIWQQYLSYSTVITSLHESVNTHQGVSTAQTNNGLSTSFHWIKSLSDRYKASLGDKSVDSWTLFSCKDLGAIIEHYQSAFINIGDNENTIFSDLHAGISFRVDFLIDL